MKKIVLKNQFIRLKSIFLLTFLTTCIHLSIKSTYAQDSTQNADALEIAKLESLLWSIVKTIQLYTLPLMAISLVFLGIKLILISDDPQGKTDIKTWMTKILIGGFVIFGASSIASALKNLLI